MWTTGGICGLLLRGVLRSLHEYAGSMETRRRLAELLLLPFGGTSLLTTAVCHRAVAGGAPCHPVHFEHHGTWRAALPRNPGSGVVLAGTVIWPCATLPARCCRQVTGPLVLPKYFVVLQAARRRRLIAFEGTTVTEFKARGCVASTANAAACLRWHLCAGMSACRTATGGRVAGSQPISAPLR